MRCKHARASRMSVRRVWGMLLYSCGKQSLVGYPVSFRINSLTLSLSHTHTLSQCNGILRLGHSHPGGPQIAEGEACTWRRATRVTLVQLDAVSVAQLGRNSQKSVSWIRTRLRQYRAHFSEFVPCAASGRAHLCCVWMPTAQSLSGLGFEV